jgi:prepilin-type N-terminal cleavage/methylation domain-containing protein
MKEMFNKSVFSEKGVTLIEILVSIVILSIIVVTFLSMYVQSAKTNRISENILDSTYIAQTQMENIYNLSTSGSFSEGLDMLKNDDFNFNEVTCNNKYCFEKQANGYYVMLTITSNNNVNEDEDESNGLYSVLIEIFNNRTKDRKEAQIETIINWKN